MDGTAASWWRLVEMGAWLAAAASLWLLCVNRWIINWVDGPLKSAAMVAALALLVSLAASCALGGHRTRLRPIPLLVLAVVAAGEIRRAHIRHRSAASPPVSSTPQARSDWHPVTTTDLVVLHHEVGIPALHADRLRVAHVTDLHVDKRLPFEHYVSALHAATACEPDLLLLTGDFVSSQENIPLLSELLRGRLHARQGVFGVLGNHDYWTDAEPIRAILAREGVHLIAGRCHHLELASVASVQVCGTERPWGRVLQRGMLKKGAITIVLSHTPDNIYELARLGATAVFGGHYHGGQFRIPGLGAVVVPSRYGRRFDRGHFRVDGTHLFVSSGVGADSPPLRLFSRPDVLVVDFFGGALGSSGPPIPASAATRAE